MFGLEISEKQDAVRYFGARAIFNPDSDFTIDILFNRVGFKGPEVDADGNVTAKTPEFDAFMTWVQNRAIPELNRQIKEAGIRKDQEIDIEVRDFKYVMRANPKSSYGYLYIGAAELPVEDLGAGTGDEDHMRLYKVGGETIRWSNPSAPPAVGETVTAVSGFLGEQKGTVAGYNVSCGYLNLLVKLDNPPKKWVDQRYNREVYNVRAEVDKVSDRLGRPYSARERIVKERLRERGLYPKREGLALLKKTALLYVAGVDLPATATV